MVIVNHIDFLFSKKQYLDLSSWYSNSVKYPQYVCVALVRNVTQTKFVRINGVGYKIQCHRIPKRGHPNIAIELVYEIKFITGVGHKSTYGSPATEAKRRRTFAEDITD